MGFKDDLQDAWRDLDSELTRVSDALDGLSTTQFKDLEGEIDRIIRDATDARNATDKLEKLIDAMKDEE
jgi:predicted  nucleic acid-binding Zn-ribbon protein